MWINIHFISLLTSISFLASKSCYAFQWNSRANPQTGNTTSSPSTIVSCNWERSFTLSRIALAAVLILTGLFISLTAYRRRRVSFFLIGTISGSLIAHYICLEEKNVSTTIALIASAASGLIIALFSSIILYCGYFLTGMLAGCTLGITVLLPITFIFSFPSATLPSLIVACFCVVQTFITLWWRRVPLIVSSAVVGSTFAIIGIDYYVENLFLLSYIEQRVFYSNNYQLCWHNYALFSAWLVLIIIGIVVQFCVTGKQVQDKSYVFVYRMRSPSNPPYNPASYAEDQRLVCAELSNV